MTLETDRNDGLTIGALAILAALTATVAHEALGHGGACLALGGHITRLSSALFHCDARSPWITAAGPAMNLLIGTLALILSRWIKPIPLKLYLVLVTAFSYFWDAGYLAQAMLTQNGDLYFVARDLFDEPADVWRIGGGLAGVVLYLSAIRLTSGALLELWPRTEARRVARIGWISATAATVLAALAYRDGIGQNLHDTVMEIAVASLPLLIIPLRDTQTPQPSRMVRRHPAILIFAVAIFIAFTLTQGRGLG